MTQWFQERFISRDQHQQIVDYYRKMVAHLQHQVCQLRATQPDAEAMNDMTAADRRSERDSRRSGVTPAHDYGGNVVSLDSRRRNLRHSPQ